MWFVQLIHKYNGDFTSFVLKPKHGLYLNLTWDDVTLYLGEYYPDYNVVHLTVITGWQGEKHP